MGDYGNELQFGVFLTPSAADPGGTVELAALSERAGLDLVTFQDHPYQPRFLDTWTLLTWVAARTERVQLSANVHNLPLRPPAVHARAAASLDLLSGGRVNLGLGSGGFWDAIVAMGGPRRTPGEAVSALEEAIGVFRELWNTDEQGGIFRDGEFYPLAGAKRGPKPAHEIPIWLGAYKPRMLRLVGASADGWLPSLGYFDSFESIAEGNSIIDESAREVGRDPSAIRRLLNIGADVAEPGTLAELATEYGIDTFILASDDASELQRFGTETAPQTRALVKAAR